MTKHADIDDWMKKADELLQEQPAPSKPRNPKREAQREEWKTR